MKKLFSTLLILALVVLLGSPSYAYKKKEANPTPTASDESTATPAAENAMPGMDPMMMEKMKEFMTPNENHAVLNYFAGNWDYSMKWWMKPDAPPEETTGTSEGKWILDGRFLEQNVRGMSMGQPFEGKALVGYDNAKKEYKNIWLDNMGTGLMMSSSSYDPAMKTFTEKGTHSCPLEASGEKSYRATITIKDDDHYTYEWFTTPPNDPTASEFKAMEINYTRKK